MSEKATDGQSNEQTLVKLYMELTGATESGARSVMMYLDPADREVAKEAEANTFEKL